MQAWLIDFPRRAGMRSKSNSNADLHAGTDSWGFHLTYVAQSDDLKPQEKKQVLYGLTKLKQVFDDDWLRQARKEHHPLVAYIINKAPWSQLWLAQFGMKLDALNKLANFSKLVRRLRSSKEYTGAEAELEAAAKLITAGITNIELYPEIKVKGKPKTPDLRAIVGGQDIYFEVKALREPKDSVDASWTHQQLTYTLFDRETLQHELLYFCQIHKILSRPRIEEFRTKIRRAIAEVKQTKEYAYIREQGILDYLVIHQSKQEQCDALVKRFGIKKEISGPPFKSDDIMRLKHKLQESGQLPEDKPGVMIVFGNLLYFGSEEHFYEDLVYQLEDTIYDLENVVLASIISKTVGLEQVNKIAQKPHYILVRKSHNLVQETMLVLENRYSKFPVNKEILSALATSSSLGRKYR